MYAPAGVGGNVAADSAGTLTRRIGCEMVAVRLEVIGQPQVDDAGFDDGVAVAEVNFEDAFHARQGNHHPAADG